MSVRKELPFRQVNETAFAQYPPILFRWFPNGQLVDGGKEFAVGDLSGSASHKKKGGGSVKVNLKTGEWGEFNGGDPKGGDPISLYAWAFCGGKMGEACKLLGAELGIYDGPLPGDAKVVPFPVKNPPRAPEPKDDWKPMVPPPDGVAAPTEILGKWGHVFTYLDPNGRLLRYVLRNDKNDNGPKVVRPLTYGLLNGKPGWYFKGPDDPKGLYGLERLADGRPVILQEGEKKTDQIQALFPNHACLSLTGGTGGKNCNDLEPLRGRIVTLVPDNDAGGLEAMRHVAGMLTGMGCLIALVDVSSHGFPPKWDLGNAIEDDGWTAEQLRSFLDDNLQPFETGGVDQEQPEESDAEWKEDNDALGSAIVPLGHDRGLYYYLSRSARQVVGLTAAHHNKLHLMALADKDKHWGKTKFMGEKGVSWDDAANALMRACEAVGIYQPDRIRGRGAWLDGDRAVLHLGESLMVDGEWHDSLMLSGSPFVYEAAARLNQTVADPLRNAEANKLLRMCQLLRWEKPISATLAAGWIMIAPICGVLHWRPAVWVTGSSNSGKTTFQRDIIAPILGRIAVPVQSKTTEAGLRQTLNTDARPVIFDEAEAEQIADKARMQSVIDLVRQSSSEGGAEIVKGTQNQSGAKRYRIRSCFMFSSINVSLDHLADESRITVLDLYNPGPDELDADRERWNQLQALMAETVADPVWCAGMVARSVKLMHVIRKNAETFKWAVAEKLGSSRVGDQLGTLLAGAYALSSDREITPEEARLWLERPENDLSCASSAEAAKDEERLTSRLMQQRMKVDLGEGKVIERTVGEVLGMAEDSNQEVAWVYHNALKRHGLKYEDGGVWVSNTHHEIKTWLRDTPWSMQWGRALKRLPGAKSSDKQTIAFGKWDKTKAVWVPLKAMEG